MAFRWPARAGRRARGGGHASPLRATLQPDNPLAIVVQPAMVPLAHQGVLSRDEVAGLVGVPWPGRPPPPINGACMPDDAQQTEALSEPPSWRIAQQGFRSRNLHFDVTKNADGFVLTYRTPAEHWQIFFSPGGQLTHVRHHGAFTLAAPFLVDAEQDALRP